MNQKIVLSFSLPPLSPDVHFRSFKITPRMQNAHAYVNAAFLADVDPATFVVKTKPSLVFGGIQLKPGYQHVRSIDNL
jgi:xanthine dehydrogenase/oxidase